MQKRCLQRAKARGGVRAAAASFGRGDIGHCEDPDAYYWERTDPDDYDLVCFSPSSTRSCQQSRHEGASQQRLQLATGGGLAASAAPASSSGVESSGAEAESAEDAIAAAALAEENGLEETRRAAWRQARRVSMQTFLTGCFLSACPRVNVHGKDLT